MESGSGVMPENTIEEIATKILNVEQRINSLEEKIASEEDPYEKKQLREEKNQLWDDKKQLRDDKKQLREKELLQLRSDSGKFGLLRLVNNNVRKGISFGSWVS